jgi:hypothetical protein
MCCAAMRLFAAQAPAATPAAEQQAKAWLAAFNSGDRATLLEYLKTNRPSDADHIDGLMGFRGMTGGFDCQRQ